MQSSPELVSRVVHELRFIRITKDDYRDMCAGMRRLAKLDRQPSSNTAPFQGFRHTRIELYIKDLIYQKGCYQLYYHHVNN